MLHENYWGPKESTCFATDLLNAMKFKNVGQSWPFFFFGEVEGCEFLLQWPEESNWT